MLYASFSWLHLHGFFHIQATTGNFVQSDCLMHQGPNCLSRGNNFKNRPKFSATFPLKWLFYLPRAGFQASSSRRARHVSLIAALLWKSKKSSPVIGAFSIVQEHEAKASGIKLTATVYPTVASLTGNLLVILPIPISNSS